jgi:hypothetical protein
MISRTAARAPFLEIVEQCENALDLGPRKHARNTVRSKQVISRSEARHSIDARAGFFHDFRPHGNLAPDERSELVRSAADRVDSDCGETIA